MLRPSPDVIDFFVDHYEKCDAGEKPKESRHDLDHKIRRKHHFTDERISDKHPEDTGVKHQSDPTEFIQQQSQCHGVRPQRNSRHGQDIGLSDWLQFGREYVGYRSTSAEAHAASVAMRLHGRNFSIW
ncbi:MAG: hypothetical protein WKF77_23305 [Planctomycetaceae bacterium]